MLAAKIIAVECIIEQMGSMKLFRPPVFEDDEANSKGKGKRKGKEANRAKCGSKGKGDKTKRGGEGARESFAFLPKMDGTGSEIYAGTCMTTTSSKMKLMMTMTSVNH